MQLYRQQPIALHRVLESHRYKTQFEPLRALAILRAVVDGMPERVGGVESDRSVVSVLDSINTFARWNRYQLRAFRSSEHYWFETLGVLNRCLVVE